MADHERPGDSEVYESIPWQDLVDLHSDRRRWLPPAAALLLIGVLAFGVARTFRPSPQELSVPSAPVSAATDTPPGTAAPVRSPETSAAGPSAPPGAPDPGPPSYSEADLMAVGEATLVATAAAVAEWFVVEWFTIDGSEPSGWTAGVDGGPHGGDGRSYVEWVRATSVDQLNSGAFRVEVVVRRLAATDPSSGYRRIPTETVELVIDLTGEAPMVVDLPRPVTTPRPGPLAGWASPDPDPPEALTSLARRAVGAPEGSPVSLWPAGDGWRAVITVPDAAGILWPVAVWMDSTGAVTTAGRQR